MNPRIVLLAASSLLGACAVGPSYHQESPVPAGTRVGSAPLSGASRLFFDSLSAARDADTSMRTPIGQTPPPLRRVETDVLGELAWLDILQDSTLTRLVETALRQNRNLAIARARIREFKAEVGVARAPLFPSVTLNGSGGRNQIAIGAFDPATFDAVRVTGDLAWELDFWGRTRRGVQAAQADLAAREAAERATVLTLVSEVAIGYLQLLELDQEKELAEGTLASRKETLALARQRFTQGIISELDVKQFEAQVAVPAVRLAQVAQERARQEHALSVLLGETPREIPRGPSLALAARAVTVADSLPATLLERRPDVQEA
ncbi:MAG: TolC family protein, partial [Gemmatimonadales bacterium]